MQQIRPKDNKNIFQLYTPTEMQGVKLKQTTTFSHVFETVQGIKFSNLIAVNITEKWVN